MNGLDLIYLLLGGILGALIVCAHFLHRMLNIFRQWNNGEPTQEDLRDIEYSTFKKKE